MQSNIKTKTTQGREKIDLFDFIKMELLVLCAVVFLFGVYFISTLAILEFSNFVHNIGMIGAQIVLMIWAISKAVDILKTSIKKYFEQYQDK